MRAVIPVIQARPVHFKTNVDDVDGVMRLIFIGTLRNIGDV